MKHLFLLIGITVGYVPFASGQTPVTSDTTKSYPSEPLVYICNSATAHAYHRSDTCQGLDYCTHPVLTISKKKAEQTYKRLPCKRCAIDSNQ